MVLPKTKAVDQLTILEARHKLSDHLPSFWASMLKLSRDLRELSKSCTTIDELVFEAEYLVDTEVRPSLIDLRDKILKEKKAWSNKILSPNQENMQVSIGNPSLSTQQIITNASILGGGVSMQLTDNMRLIEPLQSDSGITFLLEAEDIFDTGTQGPEKYTFIT